MAKIPFDIKLWPEIESGRYKVVTEHGEPVEIVKWDCKWKYPILAVINDGDTDDSCFFGPDGTSPSSKEKLFILTDEPELTEFEKAVEAIYESCGVKELRIKEKAAKLLGIAYYQFEEKRMKDGIATISKSALEKMLKDRYEIGKSDGYAKGQEDTEKRYNEATAFHYPLTPVPPTAVFYPPCFWGAPCTNPQHDCINCSRQGATGPYSTDTNIK